MKKIKTISRIVSVFIVVSILLLCLTNCSKSSTDGEINYDDLIIVLERTACFGTCPVYTLTIYGDGTVVFEGKEFVKTTGRIESNISEEKIKEIISEFKKIDFFTLNDDYVEHDITDAQSVITTITIDGKTKTIEHYHGDFSAPEELSLLEDKIDEIVGSDQWIE